jgi:hypothetical protein
MKKQCGFWYENGKLVESFSQPLRNSWIKSWVEIEGKAFRLCYFHRLLGGTFIYPDAN